MPEQPASQAEPVELTKSLRAAIKQSELENVLRAAGATEITGQATEVLGETTAAHVAPLLAEGRFEAPSHTRAPESKLTEAAQAAFEPSKLEEAFESAGIDPKQGEPVAAREMARIAQGATEFAKAEGRPVCHNCTAIGAARAASQLGPQAQSQR